MRKLAYALLLALVVAVPAVALTIAPPIGSITINGHTYTNSDWEANPQGTLVAIINDFVAVVSSINPGAPGVPVVATLTDLKALSTATYSSAIRQGFYARGDVYPLHYTKSASACTLNSGDGDDGYEVESSDGKCWIATFSAVGADVRQWGAKGDGSNDDGPAFRAACAWALSSAGKSTPIRYGSGSYLFESLDGDGGAGVYTSTGNDDGAACSLIGPHSAFDYAVAGALDGPAILKLGDGLNRPLLRHRELGASSHVKNTTLECNKSNQTGWGGGPALGRLFCVQVDDTTEVYPETGYIFDDVVIQGGYNGNLYIGGSRFSWGTRLWSQYSGQDTADYSIWSKGYDVTLWLPAIGNNAGGGMLIESGSQYQIFAGAMWENGAAGLAFGGLQVNYANIFGTNFHANDIGIRNLNTGPFSGSASIAGITCTGCTFDQNASADMLVDAGGQVNRQMKLVAPSFLGHSGGGTKPAYNIQITSGGGIVEVVNPTIGTQGSYATAFASDPALVFCNGSECPSTAFTPTLGNGSPTYSGTRAGWAARAGNIVHAQATVTVTDWGGATGNAFVGSLPWYARTQTGYVPGCNIGSASGWAAPTDYDWLTASITGGENSIILRKNSKTGVVSAGSDVSEWAAGTTVTVSCDYIGQ